MSLNDELLSHHIATLKRASGLGNSVSPYLDRMKTLVRKAVAGFDSDKRTAARLEKLLDKLSEDMTIPAKEWIAELKDELRSFAKYETSYQAETIGGWVGVNMTEPAFSQVWAAAKFNPVVMSATQNYDFMKMMNDWPTDEVSRMVMAVKNGFSTGLSTREIIKNVVGDGGLAGVSQRNAMTIAGSATMHLASNARIEFYNENNDVIIGYAIVATLDIHTTAQCRRLDGTVVLNTDRVKPRPIFHAGCRTTTSPKLSPEFDVFDVGAKRAARGADGGQQVSQGTTYYDFLKRQPAAFQDEVLGKTKGKVFRNAGLSTEEFRRITTDDFGKELTLEQMIARDKRVAKYLRG